MLKLSIVKWPQKWIFQTGRVFSGIPKLLGNCHFQCKFKIIGQAKKGVSVQKYPILRPLYNRYFCHFTIIKWSWISQNSTRKCFFWRYIILKIDFPLNFLLQLFEHYAKVKDQSKMVSKVIFLDLTTFLMDINARQHKFWIWKFYAT